VILIGLTGSVGMGKTTTAAMFAAEGAPVWDADAAVHRLYARGGAAVAPVAEAFAGAVVDEAVDRARLAAMVHADPAAFERLEAIVQPRGAADRGAFIERAQAQGAATAVLDIPLLFETGAEDLVDAVVVVTAPEHVQRERVLARPGMDETRLAALLERQTPDRHKRARADFVIDTSLGRESARARVRTVLEAVHSPAFESRRRSP
jgi:dephospho-CoA kinase